MMRALILLLVAVFLAGCAGGATLNTLRDADADTIYQAASTSLNRGDWQTAIERLELLQAQYPFGPQATQAQLDVIYAYYRSGDAISAVSAAERFRRINPRHESVAYTWYMQGVALEEQGDDVIKRFFNVDMAQRDPRPRERAFDAFQTIIERFPNSDYAPDAERRISAIYEESALHELAIAEFYVARNAWVAAARRATFVIESYPGTAAIDRAAEILEQSYQALELDDLAENLAMIRQRGFEYGTAQPALPTAERGEDAPVIPGLQSDPARASRPGMEGPDEEPIPPGPTEMPGSY